MDGPARQLPRGRHGLTRDQVETDQRLRIFVGMTDAMASQGYIDTPVAQIIRRAGVSRETFYHLYPDKLTAFLEAFDLVEAVLMARLTAELDRPGERFERLERAFATYLETLADEPGYARLFLVEVHAAGPQAMARRTVVQQRISDAIGDVLGSNTDEGRFACRMLVAAIGAMVTGPIVAGDTDALRALGPPIVEHVRRLDAAGVLNP